MSGAIHDAAAACKEGVDQAARELGVGDEVGEPDCVSAGGVGASGFVVVGERSEDLGDGGVLFCVARIDCFVARLHYRSLTMD